MLLKNTPTLLAKWYNQKHTNNNLAMRNPIQLTKDAFDIVRRNIVLFLGIMLIPMVLSFIGGLFAPTPAEQLIGIGFSPAYIVMMLLSGILNIFMSIALILAIQNNSLKITSAYKQSVSFVWRYFVMSIVMSVLLFIGFLLFIIPGIILSVWFSFATFVLVIERGGIIDSLKKSREYVRGRWWAVFGRLIALGVLMIIIGLVISSLASVLSGTLGNALVSALVMVLAPFGVAYVYLMYQDVKGGAMSTESVTPAL